MVGGAVAPLRPNVVPPLLPVIDKSFYLFRGMWYINRYFNLNHVYVFDMYRVQYFRIFYQYLSMKYLIYKVIVYYKKVFEIVSKFSDKK